jgi:hypothetical protein
MGDARIPRINGLFGGLMSLNARIYIILYIDSLHDCIDLGLIVIHVMAYNLGLTSKITVL